MSAAADPTTPAQRRAASIGPEVISAAMLVLGSLAVLAVLRARFPVIRL